MRYGVLGTGAVGSALGGKLVELGHEVVMGSRTKDNPQALEWAQGAGPRAGCGTFADSAAFAERIVVAVNGRVALAALQAAGEAELAGKLLVDVSNPIAFEDGLLRVAPVESDSVGALLQRSFPEARVVKTLNTVNLAVMIDPDRVPGEHQLFMCGDDVGAKEETVALLGEFGWPAHRVLDLGGIVEARGLEMLMPFWMNLYQRFGDGSFNYEIRRGH
ncbi:NADPH-dependent F420 reductase [Streptomyces beijiangensis]|uniref:NAD(P)-binding domain-containing protein n=1 Tax=Streptomyces beijiangensis TaxID=163361 RepID=A0A939F2U9_9ACTN|nr:NAD(P)-binding domain-containing protein [Streptomyces beijiangensis]MBO0511102.1 NAD(P)-binding domain-containing protein [Streptomyces beijiangensis]